MEKFRYSVILADSNLFEVVGSADVLSNMCSELFILTEGELRKVRHKDNWIYEIMSTINHEDILYVSRNQANIYRMNCMCEDIACCFVNDSTIDYADVLVQHEIPNVMQLTRIQRPGKLS